MRDRARALAAAFLALFSIVGFALYGLPFFYDFFVQDLGWTRRQVTSGNAISKVVVGPVFGFLAGLIIDRFGARRLMLAGIVMAGAAVVGLSTITTPGGFYVFYFLNALGYVCGGPLPCQVLLTRWFDDGRGKAMGVAYLGIAIGGTTQNLKLYLSLDRHLDQADIAGILSLLLVGSLVGRITMGWLADRWEKKYVMVLVYAIVALSIPPLAMSSMPAMLRVFAFLFGVGLGGDYMLIPLMAAELFGVRVMGRLLGVIITADGLAE